MSKDDGWTGGARLSLPQKYVEQLVKVRNMLAELLQEEREKLRKASSKG